MRRRFAGDSGKANFAFICGGSPDTLESLWEFCGVTGGELSGIESSEEFRSLDM